MILLPFGFSKDGETKVFIIYSHTTALLIPIVNFFIFDPSSSFNHPLITVVLSLYFLVIPFVARKKESFIAQNLDKFIIYGMFIVTLHAFLIFFEERTNPMSFFTFLLVAFGITIAIQKRIPTIIYCLLVLSLYFFTLVLTENYTSFNSFFIFFFVISIAYIISYTRYYLYNLLKKSNDYLTLSQETYQAFFDESQDLIVVVSKAGQILGVNKKYLKLSGKDKYDLIGKDFHNLTDHRDEESKLFDSYRYFTREKTISEINFQTELVFKNKKIPTITRLTENYYFGERCDIFFFRDITEIVENETKLKRGRENLALVLDNINSIVYYVFIDDNQQKHIRYISPQIRKMIGITVDEFITYLKSGKIIELYHPEDFKEIQKTSFYISQYKEDQVQNYRIKNRNKDEYIWVEEKIYPKFNEEGKHIANFGIITDVSERIANENKLKASEKKYKQLFDKNMAGVFQTELDGSLINFNETFVRIFGYNSFEEVNQLTADDFYFSKEDRDQYIGYLKNTGSITNYFVKLKKKDGDTIWANLNSNIVNYEGREIIEGTLIDVTESKKYEQQLSESEKQYTMLFTRSSEGIFILIDQKIEKINSKIVSYFDIKNEEDVIGLTMHDFFHKTKTKINSKEGRDRFSEIYKTENLFFESSFQIEEEDLFFEVSTTSFKNQEKQITQVILKDISQRKKFEEALLESRESFQNTLDNVPDAIVVFRNDDLLYYNPAFSLMINDDIDGYNFSLKDYFSSQDFKVLEESIKDVNKGLSSKYQEIKLLSKNGKKTDIGVQVVKSLYNSEEAVILIMQDVSYRYELSKEKLKLIIQKETNKKLQEEIEQHKKTQLRLSELEKYTRSIINSSTDTIVATNSDGFISEVNAESLKKFGYEEKDVLDKSLKIFFRNKEKFKKIKEIINQKGIYEGEFKGLNKDGTIYPGYITTSRLINEKGESLGYMGIIKDISKQKEAEKKLRAQNSKINAIFENNSNVLIWTIDKKLNLTSFNKVFDDEAQRVFKKKPAIGMNYYDLMGDTITPSIRDKVDKILQSAFEGNPEEMEGYLKYDNNRKMWLDTFISPIKYDGVNVDELAMIAHDTTEKIAIYKKMKESLFEKKILLKEVHHRVKNNLQVISSILNLQSSYVKDRNTLEILKESQNRIKSMSFIHENLYQTENFSSINFSEYLVNLSVNLLHTYQMDQKKIELEQKTDEVTLNLDQAIPCGLIVNELVSNALKYAFINIKQPKLTLEIRQKQNNIIIIVADNGIGLPEDIDLENVDSLGLQLVYTLIDQIDGKINIERSSGTKFIIQFLKQ